MITSIATYQNQNINLTYIRHIYNKNIDINLKIINKNYHEIYIQSQTVKQTLSLKVTHFNTFLHKSPHFLKRDNFQYWTILIFKMISHSIKNNNINRKIREMTGILQVSHLKIFIT